jgi:hypothetical protein
MIDNLHFFHSDIMSDTESAQSDASGSGYADSPQPVKKAPAKKVIKAVKVGLTKAKLIKVSSEDSEGAKETAGGEEERAERL